MIKLDHLGIDVSDLRRARDWYVTALGMEVEFESPAVIGLKDAADFTLILAERAAPAQRSLFFQVDDAEAAYQRMVDRGVEFHTPPQPNMWGYGAELVDPDGRLVGLWDTETMNRD